MRVKTGYFTAICATDTWGFVTQNPTDRLIISTNLLGQLAWQLAWTNNLRGKTELNVIIVIVTTHTPHLVAKWHTPLAGSYFSPC